MCYTVDAMLSLDFIRQYPQIVREGLRRRRDPHTIDDILRYAEQRRGLVTRCDGLYVTLKGMKEDTRSLTGEQRTEQNRKIKAVTQDIRLLELQMADIDTYLQPLLLGLPNLPHQSVREGSGEADDQEVGRWGSPVSFYFEPQPHWELGERLGIMDFEDGSRIAGSSFVMLKGAGARLERALITFMLDIHTREHGYTEVLPPQVVKRSVMQGAGQLPKFENQAYLCPEDELYLNPTAEVPLVGMHSDTVLSGTALPLRYVAWTTAFRREAGSSSIQTRGLLRLHQFNKVELFQYVEPGSSYQAFDEMLSHAQVILQQLDLTYRVVSLCSANLPFTSAKTADIEVWMPALGRFVEVSSVSNCEAFQARRANIKYRALQREKPTGTGGRLDYVHTLNASGLAVGRTMAAILETYQQADGSVIVPKVLRPYMGLSVIAHA